MSNFDLRKYLANNPLLEEVVVEGKAYFPKIDYKYWLSKATTGETDDRAESLAGMVTKMKNRGLLEPDSILYKIAMNPDGQRKYQQEIWSNAKEIADRVDLDLDDDKDKLLAVFNAVQLWGGTMGFSPYKKDRITKKQRLTTEEEWNEVYQIYKEGAKLAKEGKYLEALEKWNTIKGVKTSFSTKHLGFWAKKPIYDTRMSRMIFGDKVNPDDYPKYLDALEQIAKQEDIDNPFEIEQALFVFSNNYFDNELTKWEKDSSGDDTDYAEAEKILDMRSGGKSNNQGEKTKRTPRTSKPVEKIKIPSTQSKSFKVNDKSNIYVSDLYLQKNPDLKKQLKLGPKPTSLPGAQGSFWLVQSDNVERV